MNETESHNTPRPGRAQHKSLQGKKANITFCNSWNNLHKLIEFTWYYNEYCIQRVAHCQNNATTEQILFSIE